MARLTGVVGRHPVSSALLAMVATLVGVGLWVWMTQVRVPYVEVSYLVPSAPQLSPEAPDQTVYRIDASRSSVRYEVEESLAGVEKTATGSTSGVAGDVLVDEADPSRSQMGQIVVDVQQFDSDEELRDQRLQHDFLESKDFPRATFDTEQVEGLPAVIDDGTDYDVALVGTLTVKEIPAPATLTGTVRRDGDELVISVSTVVKLSTYRAGPIRLLGFVSTGDDVRLVVEAVAVDASKASTPGAFPAPRAELAVGEGPSFARVVQPILASSCAGCHQDGGAGSAYWRLETAADAVPVASGLGLVVGAGYMPPWHATSVGVPNQHDARLTEDQVAAVVAWADAGAPLDVDPVTPIEAQESLPTIREDVAVEMAEPYDATSDKVNDYRCIILDPGFTERTWVQATDFRPGQPEIVHHATTFRLPVADQEAAEARDAADPGPGWTCTTGTGGGAQFDAWAPGRYPVRMPEGSAIPFEAGEKFVVQMHYHETHQVAPDQSTLLLELADGDVADLDEVSLDVLLGPAEIPCATDEQGPLCDREAVRAEIARDFGPQAAFIGDALMGQCGATLDDFTAMTDGTASASCDHRARHDGEIIVTAGHMHERGATFRMTLNPDTPDELVLLDIANWDFNWQRAYLPVDPVPVERGDVIRIECSWDRDRKPQIEPRYITWAEGTEDEMCYSTVATRLTGDQERDR